MVGWPQVYSRISFSGLTLGKIRRMRQGACAWCRGRDLAYRRAHTYVHSHAESRYTLIFSKHLCAPSERSKARAKKRERKFIYEKERVQNIIKIYINEKKPLSARPAAPASGFTNCVHINIYSPKERERENTFQECAFLDPQSFSHPTRFMVAVDPVISVRASLDSRLSE